MDRAGSGSLFSYEPLEIGLVDGVGAMDEIIQTIVLVILTIIIWKVKWLKPSAYNSTLWAKYPSQYGRDPDNKYN